MAYERFGKWVLRIVATSLPISGVGILFKACVIDNSLPKEQMWLFWVLLILCISIGCMGAFLVLLAEDIREKRRPKPKYTPNKSDPIFTLCSNIEITHTYELAGIIMINIRCQANAFDYQGCPETCSYYRVPKPTPGGLLGGAIIGAIIGAAVGGPGGAVLGSVLGAGIGGGIEAQTVRPTLQQQINKLDRQGKPYQISFQ